MTADPEVGTATATADRRRPGRPLHVSPELIPILRLQWREPLQDDTDPDDLRPIHGLGLAVAVCALFWLGLAAAIAG